MRQEQIKQLLDAAGKVPSVHSGLLARAAASATSLGIALESSDIAALHAAELAIRADAEQHDNDQARTGKQCVFYPVLGTLPTKGPRKVPKPRRKKPKPSK